MKRHMILEDRILHAQPWAYSDKNETKGKQHDHEHQQQNVRRFALRKKRIDVRRARRLVTVRQVGGKSAKQVNGPDDCRKQPRDQRAPSKRLQVDLLRNTDIRLRRIEEDLADAAQEYCRS